MEMILKKDYFCKGAEAFCQRNLEEAEDYLLKSYREEKCEKGLEYLLYLYLIKSNYKNIINIVQKNPNLKGFALYSLYWYKFMTGELDELSDILYKMLEEDNYFIRIFAIKELYKDRKITDLQAVLKQKVKFFGLSYNIPIEEQRASVFLDFLNERFHLSLLQAKTLLKDYPGVPDVYLDFIEICENSSDQDYIKEIINHENFLKLMNTDYRLLYAYSKQLYKMGEIEKARESLHTLLNYFRHNPIFHFNMGNIYFRMNKLLKAADSYEEAISLSPLFERAYYNLGCIYFKLGDLSRAIKNFQESVRISKKPDALYNLSVCLIEKKELQEAYCYLNKIPNWYTPKLSPNSIKKKIKEIVVFTRAF